MKRITLIYLILFGILFYYIIDRDLNRNQINWNRTYSHNDDNPMGASVFYKLLKKKNPNLTVWKKSLYQMADSNIQNSCIIFMESLPSWEPTDSIALKKLEHNNNSFIVIGNYFNAFFTSYRLSTMWKSEYHFSGDSLLTKTAVNLYPTFRTGIHRKYPYPVFVYPYSFVQFDTSSFRVFLKDTKNSVYGIQGNTASAQPVYFISMSEIFCNYFIVRHPNRYLAYALTDYLLKDKQRIIWYAYHSEHTKQKSLLYLIFENKSLHIAWLCLLITFLLYAVFDSRRNQKAIPLITDPSNETLSFVDVVANSYYKSGNHGLILREIILDFYEYVRRTYRIELSQTDEQKIHQLSSLSGCPKEIIERIIRLCNHGLTNKDISEYELTETEKLIQIFHSKQRQSPLKNNNYV